MKIPEQFTSIDELPSEAELADQFLTPFTPENATALARAILAGAAELVSTRHALEKLHGEHKSLKTKTAVAKPRPLKAMAEGKQLAGDELKAAIRDAGEVEIAFSDGRQEVQGLAPVAVSGPVWKDHPRGQMLTEPVNIAGPGGTGSTCSIAGYALLLDGKQVAYTERPEPLKVASGQKVQLADDIWF